MPNVAGRERAGWLGPALALVAAITALRVLALAFDRTDLFVDEAQYWLWGQELAFGYYSKPPLIGWVIRAATTLAGSSAPFWVRLPAPLFHGATALILAAIAAHLCGREAGAGARRRAALWVAAGYATLPMAALGSLLISTDTIMFPFLALALWAWLRLAERPKAESWLALAAGAALGLAFLAKYAAVYYLACAVIAAIGVPRCRPSVHAAVLAALAFVVVISPNILWNVAMGFPTLHHTAHNIGWIQHAGGPSLHWGKLAKFVTDQFAVFGPLALVLLGVALVRAALAGMKGRDQGRGLGAFIWPILALVMVQALLSRAYGNWAAAAYLAGTLLVFAPARAGVASAWARGAAIGVNTVICVALPLMAAFPQAVVMKDGRYALHRYLGRAALSEWIITEAHTQGLARVVAVDRDILADLFYTGRASGLAFYAVPPKGPPADHYEMAHPLPVTATGPVLLVATRADAPCVAGRQPLATRTPTRGAYRGQHVALYEVPAACLARQ